MKANRLLGAILAAGLGVMVVGGASDALAQKKKKEAPAAVVAAEPPITKKPIALNFDGVAWGQTPKQVAEAIDKLIDEDYKPQYQQVQPGVKMKSLDAQIAEDKSQFRRSRVDFGKLPTGIDASPLRGEYSYQNKETMLTLTRKGKTTAFFFIQDKLWKVIEELKLSDTTTLGKTYQDAVVNLSKVYGVPGRVVVPDATHASTEVDWKDGGSHLRAIQRGDTALGLAFVDLVTEQKIDSLRVNKPVDENAIDPAVAAAVRGKSDEPGPPPSKDTKPKPKK